MTELPPFSLYDTKGHYPHSHHVETECVVRRRGLIDITVRVIRVQVGRAKIGARHES